MPTMLNQLQNKHNNEIIFVVGSGPSIKNIPNISVLKNYTVMAVNSGILAVPFADYFCSDDAGILSWSYIDILKQSSILCLFYEAKLKESVKYIPKERIIFYKHKSWFSPPATYNLPDGIRLTKDITKPIIGSRTSMGSCVHLAYCLGAKVVVFLGNDCQIAKDGNRYFWQYWDRKKQPYRTKGNKFNKLTQNFGFDQMSFVRYWQVFAKYNKDILENEMPIINCSGGVLDCFPRMSLEEVLEKYGEK